MDDLLALLETSDEVSKNNTEIDLQTVEDETGGAFTNQSSYGNDDDGYSIQQKEQYQVLESNANISKPADNHHQKLSKKSQSCNNNTTDVHSKIRIVNRIISRIELVDILAPYNFHTAPTLAAFSNQQLSSILIHPNSKSTNNAPLSGKTNLATMGIVFTNSGTRISSNTGKAFTILTVGDLKTGPCISVLLFGSAYSTFTTKAVPGQVVAILESSLLPSKTNSIQNSTNNYNRNFHSSLTSTDTRISLSIYDSNQLKIIGKAQDYGICSGVDQKRLKSNIHNGSNNFANQYQDTSVKCKNFVDLRTGRFCKRHMNSQSQQQPINKMAHSTLNGVNSKKTNLTYIQSLRQSNPIKSLPTHQAGIMTMSTPQGMLVTHVPNHSRASSNYLTHNSNPTKLTTQNTIQNNIRGGLHNISSALEDVLGKIENVQPTSMSKTTITDSFTHGLNNLRNSNNNDRTKLHPQVPHQMQKATMNSNKDVVNSSLSSSVSSSHTKTVSVNPYHKSDRTVITPPTSTSNSPSNNDILGIALNANSSFGRKKSSTNGLTKPQTLNTKRNQPKKLPNLVHMEGFDGQVEVPKPNPLFERAQTSDVVTSSSLSCTLQQSKDESKSNVEKILEQQRNLATQIKLNSKSTIASMAPTDNRNNKNITDPSSLFINFKPLTNEEMKKILNSKSKYDNEAQAESYIKSRNAVNELEKKEEQLIQKELNRKQRQQLQQHGNKNGIITGDGGAIETEWICVTCKRRGRSRPGSCINAQHVVKRRREIKKRVGVVEERLKDKSVDDGGLVIGAGLNWSGWTHYNNDEEQNY